MESTGMKPELIAARTAGAKFAATTGLLALTLFLACGQALGSALAVTPSGTIVESPEPYPLTTAWDFAIDRPYQVTALDLYSNGSPYVSSHQVGIWSTEAATGYPVGTLIATVTFAAGTSGTANGLYRSLAIDPIVLNPGHYEVGVLLFSGDGADPYPASQTSFSLLPGFTVNGGHVETSGVFTYPGGTFFTSAYFAANLEATAAPVPLPASAWLLFAGLLGLIAVSRNGRYI
jgi:hypothetical protein